MKERRGEKVESGGSITSCECRRGVMITCPVGSLEARLNSGGIVLCSVSVVFVA
jgi:hypothetical protein